MNIDRVERHFLHEMQRHHDHPRDPKEDDVKAGDQYRCRVERLQVISVIWPAEGRKRPQCRGKPSIEHVVILSQDHGCLAVDV